MDPSHIWSALVLLLHHSLIKVHGGVNTGGGGGFDNNTSMIARRRTPDLTLPQMQHIYVSLPERARLLVRHSRYVWHRRNTCPAMGHPRWWNACC